MVQRKVANNLSIQVDHIKRQNQLVNNLKISSLHHHHDVKNKKMKKSGPIKLESPRTPNTRRRVKHPGKPPPNYMKSTTSSDARKEKSQVSSLKTTQTSNVSIKTSKNSKLNGNKATTKTTSLKTMRTLTKNPSFKPARARKISKIVPTCSSTLKDCKFPAYLELNHGGTELDGKSAIKVCPYTYCSLNGHHHRPSLPPLKSFLSAKRRVIKNQRNVIKLGCLSPRRLKPIGDSPNEKLNIERETISPPRAEGENVDFFIEIYSKDLKEDQEEQVVETLSAGLFCHEISDSDVDSIGIGETYFSEQNKEIKLAEEERKSGFLSEHDSEASDMEWEIGHLPSLYLDDDYESSPQMEIKPDKEGSEVENCVTNEYMADEVSQVSFDEQSFSSDAFSSSSTDSLSDFETSAPVEIPLDEPKPALDDMNEFLIEDTIQNQDQSEMEPTKDLHLEVSEPNCTEFVSVAVRDVKVENGESEESYLNRAMYKGCKKPIEDLDEWGRNFNPRGPNFLPLQPEQEAEKVDLRHQELDEKKNTDEWMVDYALRQAVTKLGSDRKRKVALLVEAFEKVAPTTKYEVRLRHGSAIFDHARPIQACN